MESRHSSSRGNLQRPQQREDDSSSSIPLTYTGEGETRLPWQAGVGSDEQGLVHVGDDLRLQRIDASKLQLKTRLGGGNFGEVFLAEWEGAYVAVKVLTLPQHLNSQILADKKKEFEREVTQMAQLNHPRVMILYGVSYVGITARMVLEYCPHGNLQHFLKNHLDLSWPAKIELARDIALGLEYLHQHNIIHMDLAAENIFLDAYHRPKLGDLGLAAKKVQGRVDLSHHLTVSLRPCWNPPEIFLPEGAQYLGATSDIYCYGTVLWEIATSAKIPRANANDPEIQQILLQEKREQIDPLPQDTPLAYASVLRACWRAKRESRPTASQVFSWLGTGITRTTSSTDFLIRDVHQLSVLLCQQNIYLSQQWQQSLNYVHLPYLELNCSKEFQGQKFIAVSDAINNFLSSRKTVLLLLGDSGSGKSLVLSKIAQQQWHTYSTHSRLTLLISLSALHHPEQNLVETVLQYQGLTPNEISYIKEKKIPLLLLLDGYDEIISQENLYATNQLYQWNAKIIITCRPDKVYGIQSEGKVTFYPCNAKGKWQPQELQQWILQPFSAEQIDAYLQQYFSGGISDFQRNSQKEWIKKLRALPGMQEILTNPLLLYLIVTVLPQLQQQWQSDPTTLTREAVYTTFLQLWFLQQQQKLIQNKMLAPDKDITPAMQYFTQRLAVTLFEQQTQVAIYVPAKTLFGQTQRQARKASLWGCFFDDRYHPQIPLLRASCPLQPTGEYQWRFLHKSIWEFYVSRALLEALSQDCTDSDTVEKFLLNQRLLNGESGIREFMAEALIPSPFWQQKLLQIVQASHRKPSLHIAASNAMTLLNAARFSFSGLDLSDVQIADAILSEAILEKTRFNRADLRRVVLRKAALDGIDLKSSQLENATFGQLPYLSHEAEIRGLAYDKEGRWLAAASGNTVSLWDINSRVCQRKLCGPLDFVQQIVFSPEGDRLAACSDDKTLHVWEVKTGKLLKVFNGHTQGIKSIAWHPRAQWLASSSEDGTVRLWSIGAGNEMLLLKGQGGAIKSIAFSPEGNCLVSGSEDGSIRLWSMPTGKEMATLKAHEQSVNYLIFEPQGKWFASASSDKTIRLWSASAPHTLLKSFMGHTAGVNSIACAPDRQHLASSSEDKTLRVWSIESGETVEVLEGHAQWVNQVVFHPTGKTLASSSGDKTVRLWQIDYSLPFSKRVGHTAGVTGIAFSPDGHWLVSSGEDHTLRLWHVPSGRLRATWMGHVQEVVCVAFSPQAAIVASGSRDGKILRWDAMTGQMTHQWVAHQQDVTRLCFHPNGSVLASSSYDGTVNLWSMVTHQKIMTLEGHAKPVNGLSFSPDGRLLATGSHDTTIRLWSTVTGECLAILKGHTHWVNTVTFSPDGKLLASGSEDSSIRFWSVETRTAAGTLTGHIEGVTALSFSPDGQWLASSSHASHDQFTARVWSIKENRPSIALEGHTRGVTAIAFSPEGNSIATGSYDKGVRCWRWRTGVASLQWRSHGYLTARHAQLAGANLSSANTELLLQQGAEGKTLDIPMPAVATPSTSAALPVTNNHSAEDSSSDLSASASRLKTSKFLNKFALVAKAGREKTQEILKKDTKETFSKGGDKKQSKEEKDPKERKDPHRKN